MSIETFKKTSLSRSAVGTGGGLYLHEESVSVHQLQQPEAVQQTPSYRL